MSDPSTDSTPPATPPAVDPARRRRARIGLIALFALFVLPFLAAATLHLSGWRPTDTRNHGQMLSPLVPLDDLALQRADGSAYAWEKYERRWQVLVVAPSGCAQACVDLIAGLDKVWQLQGRRADRLDVMWFGPVPEGALRFRRFVPMREDPALAARLPGLATSGAPNAYLVDPAGYVVLRYDAGFDVAQLREDAARMLK